MRRRWRICFRRTSGQLLKARRPRFKFLGLDGKPVTPETLAGKVAVLDFWSIGYRPCRQSLPEPGAGLPAVQGQPQGGVLRRQRRSAADEGQRSWRKAFEDLKVHVPVLRDRDRSVAAFKSADAAHDVHRRRQGDRAALRDRRRPEIRPSCCRAKIDKVLAGEDIYQEPLKQYHEQVDFSQASTPSRRTSRTSSRTPARPSRR